MSGSQDHDPESENKPTADPGGESGKEKSNGISKAQKISNRWVLISLCLYLSLIVLNSVVVVGTDSLSHGELGPFSLARLTSYGHSWNVVLGLFLALPALALALILIRSSSGGRRSRDHVN